MRMSVRENDKGYKNLNFNCDVYLDGVVVENCFTADEEAGVVYCYETYDNGEFKISGSGEGINEIELKGKVEIIIRD